MPVIVILPVHLMKSFNVNIDKFFILYDIKVQIYNNLSAFLLAVDYHQAHKKISYDNKNNINSLYITDFQ